MPLSASVEQQEALLSYDPEREIWHAPTLWVSDATFKRYIAPWLEGIAQPTQEQLNYAVGRCRRVGYWQHYGDPEVHFCAPPAPRNEVSSVAL